MTDSSDHDVVEAMKIQIAQLRERNEAIQASVETIQQQHHEREESQHGNLGDAYPHPLSAEIWNALVPENFKSPSLTSFDGKGDPVEHVSAFNTRMAVVKAADSLKCKLPTGTFREPSTCLHHQILGLDEETHAPILR